MQNSSINSKSLQGKKIAFLVTDGFEQVELTTPWEQFELAGAQSELIVPEGSEVQGYRHLDKRDTFYINKTLADASADEYDGLVLPGGVANPDALRTDAKAVEFVRAFFAEHKPVAAICTVPGH